MEYGDLFIIPNDKVLLRDCFHKSIFSSHLSGIQEFSDKYQLGYQFKADDYHEAPYRLANDGHFVIKTVDSAKILLCYLPEYITDDQLMWFFNNKDLFDKYSTVMGYQIVNKNNEFELDKIYGIDQINKKMNYSNVLYNKNKKMVFNGKGL